MQAKDADIVQEKDNGPHTKPEQSNKPLSVSRRASEVPKRGVGGAF